MFIPLNASLTELGGIRYNKTTDIVQIQDVDGNWHDWKTGGLLFDGIFYETGAFSQTYPMKTYDYNGNGATFSETSGYLDMQRPVAGPYNASVTIGYVTQDKIDVSNWSTLKMLCDNRYVVPSATIVVDPFVGLSTVNDGTSAIFGSGTNHTTPVASSVARNDSVVVTLDISSYTGEWYIFAGVGETQSGSGQERMGLHIYKIWLE